MERINYRPPFRCVSLIFALTLFADQSFSQVQDSLPTSNQLRALSLEELMIGRTNRIETKQNDRINYCWAAFIGQPTP